MKIRKKKYVYVVFSSTPCILGWLIRLATGHEYNHVSLALDSRLHSLYSFARRHRNMPLYGGFVRESCFRYHNGARAARVRVYRLPAGREQILRLRDYLGKMLAEPDHYIYNTFSAGGALLHRRVLIPDAYTCIEFSIEGLLASRLPLGLEPGAFYSLPDLEEKLTPFLFYEGAIPDAPQPALGCDSYPVRLSLPSGVYLTLRTNAILTRRFLSARLRRVLRAHAG